MVMISLMGSLGGRHLASLIITEFLMGSVKVLQMRLLEKGTMIEKGTVIEGEEMLLQSEVLSVNPAGVVIFLANFLPREIVGTKSFVGFPIIFSHMQVLKEGHGMTGGDWATV